MQVFHFLVCVYIILSDSVCAWSDVELMKHKYVHCTFWCALDTRCLTRDVPSWNMNAVFFFFLWAGGWEGQANICVCRHKRRFKAGRHCANRGLLFAAVTKVSEYYSLGLSFVNVSQSKQALWSGIMSASLMFNVERHSIEIWMALSWKDEGQRNAND